MGAPRRLASAGGAARHARGSPTPPRGPSRARRRHRTQSPAPGSGRWPKGTPRHASGTPAPPSTRTSLHAPAFAAAFALPTLNHRPPQTPFPPRTPHPTPPKPLPPPAQPHPSPTPSPPIAVLPLPASSHPCPPRTFGPSHRSLPPLPPHHNRPPWGQGVTRNLAPPPHAHPPPSYIRWRRGDGQQHSVTGAAKSPTIGGKRPEDTARAGAPVSARCVWRVAARNATPRRIRHTNVRTFVAPPVRATQAHWNGSGCGRPVHFVRLFSRQVQVLE